MRRLIPLSAVLLVIAAGCNPPSSPDVPAARTRPNVKPLVDIEKLTKQKPADVDALLGKPRAISHDQTAATDVREYRVAGAKEPLWVEFGKAERATAFILTLAKPAASPVEAAQRLGLYLSAEKQDMSTPQAVQWDTVRRGPTAYTVQVLNEAGNGWETVNVKVKW